MKKAMIKIKCVECGLKQEVELEKTRGEMPPMCKECFGCCVADSVKIQH